VVIGGCGGISDATETAFEEGKQWTPAAEKAAH